MSQLFHPGEVTPLTKEEVVDHFRARTPPELLHLFEPLVPPLLEELALAEDLIRHGNVEGIEIGPEGTRIVVP